MKRVCKNNFILRVCLAMCILIGLVVSGFAANAAGTEPVTVRIPFSYADESGACENAEILIEYANGMPAPDSDTKTVSSGSNDYFSLKTDAVGIYTYKVYQKAGSDPAVIYDDTVYDVTVYVTNEPGTGKLECTVTAVSNDSGAKPDKLEFVNKGTGTTETDTTETTTDTETTDSKTDTKSYTKTNKKTADEAKPFTAMIICFAALILLLGVVYVKRSDRTA